MYVCQPSLERPILLVAWEEEAQFEASRRGKIWPQFFKYICARHEPYCSGQEGGEPTLDLRVTTAMRREEREKRNEDTKLFNVDEKKHKIYMLWWTLCRIVSVWNCAGILSFPCCVVVMLLLIGNKHIIDGRQPTKGFNFSVDLSHNHSSNFVLSVDRPKKSAGDQI